MKCVLRFKKRLPHCLIALPTLKTKTPRVRAHGAFISGFDRADGAQHGLRLRKGSSPDGRDFRPGARQRIEPGRFTP